MARGHEGEPMVHHLNRVAFARMAYRFEASGFDAIHGFLTRLGQALATGDLGKEPSSFMVKEQECFHRSIRQLEAFVGEMRAVAVRNQAIAEPESDAIGLRFSNVDGTHAKYTRGR